MTWGRHVAPPVNSTKPVPKAARRFTERFDRSIATGDGGGVSLPFVGRESCTGGRNPPVPRGREEGYEQLDEIIFTDFTSSFGLEEVVLLRWLLISLPLVPVVPVVPVVAVPVAVVPAVVPVVLVPEPVADGVS
jgi:hypothetical protein